MPQANLSTLKYDSGRWFADICSRWFIHDGHVQRDNMMCPNWVTKWMVYMQIMNQNLRPPGSYILMPTCHIRTWFSPDLLFGSEGQATIFLLLCSVKDIARWVFLGWNPGHCLDHHVKKNTMQSWGRDESSCPKWDFMEPYSNFLILHGHLYLK